MAHAAAVATASAASTPPPVLRKSRIDFTEISSNVAFKAAKAAALPLLAATGRGGVASGAAAEGVVPRPRARARGRSCLAAEGAGEATATGAAGTAPPLLLVLPGADGLGTDLEGAEEPVAGAPGTLAGPPGRFASWRSARNTPRRLASSSASSRTRPAPLPLANCGFDARSLLNSALTRCARRSRANSPPSDSSRPKRSTRRRARSRSTSTWRAW